MSVREGICEVLSEEWDYVAVLGSGTATNVDPQPTRKKR
jgi:hypothetical protein